MIAPNSADIIDTIINVKAHPSSAAASGKKKYFQFIYCFVSMRYDLANNNKFMTRISQLDHKQRTVIFSLLIFRFN